VEVMTEETYKLFGKLFSMPHVFAKFRELAEANPGGNSENDVPDTMKVYEATMKELVEQQKKDQLELDDLMKQFTELSDNYVTLKEAVIKKEKEEYERVMKKRPSEKAYGKKRRQ
ncbi:hypothetical protein NPIL_33641, partial [Nephila pilipes]